MTSTRSARGLSWVSRVLLVVTLGLIGTWQSAHAAGITVFQPSKNNVWVLYGKGPLQEATMAEVTIPGCFEGPCPIDLITVFSSGHVDIIKDLRPVSQVVRVTDTQFVVATGSCFFGHCIKWTPSSRHESGQV